MARKDFRVVRNTFANDDGLPFGKLLSREYVLSTLEQEGHEYRQRVFCPLVTLWAWLSQSLSQDKSMTEAVSRIVANRVASGLPACAAGTSSYSEARTRFPLPVMEKMAKEIGRNVSNSASDEWHWHGREVFLVDGTGISMPDTPENQLAFPQTKNAIPGCGFPVMRAVGIISLATGAVVDFAFDAHSGKGTGESSLLRRMFNTFKRGDIMVADKYFPSFPTIAALQQRGVDLVSVSHIRRTVDFSKGFILGENDHIVEWVKPPKAPWMTEAAYNEMPDTMAVREFQIQIEGRDGNPENVIIVSTMTDPTIPQEELSDLFWKRWHCELDLRSIKQSMHLDVLRGRPRKCVPRRSTATCWHGISCEV